MFNFEILTSTNIKINQDIINDIFLIINKNINISQNWVLNIVFVSSEEIQKLNKTYRNIDSSTDVLSFHYFDDFLKLNKSEIAWELVFCEEKIIDQGKYYWLWEEKEFYKLLIHSILHILWYDHENENDYKIMQEFENTIWQEIFGKK